MRIRLEVTQGRPRYPLYHHPFADDFNLITRDPRSHQRILRELLKRLKALRLTLKVPKCVSLGIKGGSFTPREFFIGGKAVPTADKKDLVILGMFIPAHGGLKEIAKRINDDVSSALTKINDCQIRSEYKAEIFSKFYVP